MHRVRTKKSSICQSPNSLKGRVRPYSNYANQLGTEPMTATYQGISRQAAKKATSKLMKATAIVP